MTVPCSCRIPDPVVVNGTCLVCYGSRTAEAQEESPWKTLSRERWDAEYGEGDFDRRLEEAADFVEEPGSVR